MPSLSNSLSLSKINIKDNVLRGAWVVQSVERQLWLRAWSHGLWVQAPHRALHWQRCVSLSLCPSPTHALSLSLSLKNKTKNIKKKVIKLPRTLMAVIPHTFFSPSLSSVSSPTFHFYSPSCSWFCTSWSNGHLSHRCWKKEKKENNLWLDVQGEGEGILFSKDLSLKVHYHKIQICDQIPKPGIEAGAGTLWGLCKHLPLRGPG